MKKRTALCLVAIILVEFFIIVIGFVEIKAKHFDAALLREKMDSSNMVQIYDSELESVLYETSDEAELRWLSEAFVIDEESHPEYAMGWKAPRYYLYIHTNDEVIELRMKEQIRFNWSGQKEINYWDFRLTSESYSKVLPWLCKNTGKNLNELFPLDSGFYDPAVYQNAVYENNSAVQIGSENDD